MGAEQDTIVSRATPAGRGAVAIVRVSGPEAWKLAGELCRLKTAPAPRMARLVKIWDDKGQLLDRPLCLYFEEGLSFTGEKVVEFHLHGNPLLVEKVLDRLCQLGARRAAPGEFSRRAFENGKLSLSQAEGLRALIDAPGPEALSQAVKQLEGVLSERFRALENRFLSLIAAYEAGQDYPEEGVENLPSPVSTQDIKELLEAIDGLLATHPAWQVHHQIPKVAIIGRPNAGKSSLLNRLLGSERAIVSDIPGTTRDLVTATLQIGGRLVELVDTAGIRDSDDPIEREGIQRALSMAASANLVILLADPSENPGQTGKDRMRLISLGESPVLVVWTKRDLYAHILPPPGVESFISCKSSEGIESLLQLIQDRLGADTDSPSAEVVISERHAENLKLARQDLLQVGELLAQNAPAEVLLDFLWSALRQLQLLEGGGVTEKMLDELFSRFCLGK